MPTPAPNQPPDPSAPPPPYSLSTCPEDLQHLPYTHRLTLNAAPGAEDAMDSRQIQPSPDSSPENNELTPAPDAPDLLGSDGQAHTSSYPIIPPQPQYDQQNPSSSVSTHGFERASRTNADSGSRNIHLDTIRPDLLSTEIEQLHMSSPVDDEPFLASMGPEYSTLRAIPTSPSSFLRPGSKFHGTQQSERQVYDVQVEIKHVDLRESFLCGYLRIQGLTEDHPTLTTYFEGEIIGAKYSFITQHEDWGANHKVDLNHWSKFSAFRPFYKGVARGPVTVNDVAQKENIFMRWKEHFLVPDHRVRTITGASFEGFYYICFNQLKGEVSGIYFHSKSEKFQQLELRHVPDRGCFNAVEFR